MALPAVESQALVRAARDALTALGDAVAQIDAASGRVLWASAAMQALWSLAAVPAELATLADADRAWAGLRDGMAGARVNDAEHGARRPLRFRCGIDQAFLAEVSPLDAGRLLLRLTDERAAQRVRLRELQRQLDDRERLLFTSRSVSVGEMGSTLAHELNQPIGAAANLLRGLKLRLQRQAQGGADLTAELAAVERAVEQVMYAAKVIARIREFTHSHAPRLQPVDMAALMRSSASLLDWDLQRAGVRLSLALPAEPDAPVTVRGDEVMLQQVLVNLLRNAIDALREDPPAAPEIALSLHASAGEVEARVSDNGVGLPGDAEQRLFVPFASTKPSGMGIGLAICRSFVELHQGRLWFSRHRDRGCSFHISLPLAAATAGDASP